MDHTGHKSGHLMLITPERVFYAGLLGRPRQRCSGGFNIYVAIEGSLWLTTADGCETHGDMVALLPNIRHTIASDHRSVLSVVIEPESVRPGALEDLATRLSGPEGVVFASRIRAAYHELREHHAGSDFSSTEFDRLCLGEPLPQRELDPRVVRAIVQIGKFSGEPVTAASCAAEAGLSPSRFLHLFKEETGISFRSFRAWKRARHLLHFANQDINLAHLAQDIGYPDSTHFSHSIRRFYGLKPRAIFSGSRDLAIYSHRHASAG
ncbi:helix-turn-helix domain-containing protein [Bradyrhizobium sp. sBnM-33]|uniref:helix-turn-helix domain-containing protein n=1 Tax=Bradyrhizobium sp. sBnM-33 TaxID=2831780 RepID=UPI001BCB4DA2|nr:helix-turn-helix domain-containing protein [Bradyrhizobium sp. sBnM-33]WOH51264.1 helix-turn-helix domain-containing protein [Bradyrhizobium sp. sBnM-33]